MNSPWQPVALADKSASHTTYLLWHDSAREVQPGYWDRWAGRWCHLDERPMDPQPTMFRPMPTGPKGSDRG